MPLAAPLPVKAFSITTALLDVSGRQTSSSTLVAQVALPQVASMAVATAARAMPPAAGRRCERHSHSYVNCVSNPRRPRWWRWRRRCS